MDIEVQVDPATLTDARAVLGRLGGFGLLLCNTILSWRAVYAARASGVPCLWWIHESQFGQTLAQRNPAVARAFAAADKVMFPAASSARLYAAYVRPDQQVVLVGIDWSPAEAGVPILERPAGKLAVVSAASFEPRKGQDVLLVALRQLPTELRGRIQLYLLGQILDPRYYRRLVKSARQFPGVQILSAMPRAEALKYLSGADVIVLASRDEVVPLVLLEAMALGKGIVATSVGGIPEVVEHGAHAWLVPPDDPAALAQGLTRVLQDETLRARLGSAAQKRYAELYTFDRFVDDVSGLMRQMTAARQAAGQVGMPGQRELQGDLPAIYHPPPSFMRIPETAASP
jgi:glycosyltransferase involved in cell wall biosynthesis